MTQQDQKWEGEGYGGPRQLNFIQKLYDFLALDPHPYADTLYWATDGRQLVIAQPDKLVKEVLPKLFKHDKLSSFGRQLNIYGFSRLFPGRQFKDANGNVSDASVWAHPSLHRLSTPDEIAGIKRRAAPKLFRTRRLANGQIVRTRAGPAVEAKAREVRESIAESRRHRGSVGSIYSAGSYEERSPEPLTPGQIHANLSGHVASSKSFEASLSLSFTDKSRLGAIVEGETSLHVSPPSDLEHDRRESLISIDGNMFQQSPPGHGPGQVQQTFHAQQSFSPVKQESLPLVTPQEARQFHSCPASIHTTPIPTHLSLAHAGWSFLNPFAENQIDKKEPQQSKPTNLHINTAITRIAAPAAPPPFTNHLADQIANSFQHYPLSPSSGTPSNTATWNNTPVPGTPLMSSSFDPQMQQQQIQASWGTHTSFTPSQPQASLEGQMPMSPPGTIDPRWVSPLSSLWNTPAGTPRSGSPINLMMCDSAGTIMQQQGTLQLAQSLDVSMLNSLPPGRMYGTQSYPPRVVERRHMDAPNLSFWDQAMQAIPQSQQQQGGSYQPQQAQELQHPRSGQDLQVSHSQQSQPAQGPQDLSQSHQPHYSPHLQEQANLPHTPPPSGVQMMGPPGVTYINSPIGHGVSAMTAVGGGEWFQ